VSTAGDFGDVQRERVHPFNICDVLQLN